MITENRAREYPGSNSTIEYIQDPAQCFKELLDFVTQLQAQNPNHKYPNKTHLEEFDPKNPKRFKDVEKNLRAYLGKEDSKNIAIALGEEKNQGFELDWLFIKPEFRNGEVADKIFKILFEKYAYIKLLASAQFGYKPKFDDSQIDKNRVSRQNLLVEYYKKRGFQEDKDSEIYKYSDVPGTPMPMIWKK